MEASPPDEYAVLCDEIRTLLDPQVEAHEQSLARLEDTLTEGYARALALEAEQWRLERRIGELGAGVRRGDEQSGEEITTLAARLAQASGRLAGLRDLLDALRRRADAVRTRQIASFG
jgi:hypothetical protein